TNRAAAALGVIVPQGGWGAPKNGARGGLSRCAGARCAGVGVRGGRDGGEVAKSLLNTTQVPWESRTCDASPTSPTAPTNLANSLRAESTHPWPMDKTYLWPARRPVSVGILV